MSDGKLLGEFSKSVSKRLDPHVNKRESWEHFIFLRHEIMDRMKYGREEESRKLFRARLEGVK